MSKLKITFDPKAYKETVIEPEHRELVRAAGFSDADTAKTLFLVAVDSAAEKLPLIEILELLDPQRTAQDKSLQALGRLYKEVIQLYLNLVEAGVLDHDEILRRTNDLHAWFETHQPEIQATPISDVNAKAQAEALINRLQKGTPQ